MLINRFEAEDFSKIYAGDADKIEKARWGVNFYEVIMPFGAVLMGLVFFALIVICLRTRYYQM